MVEAHQFADTISEQAKELYEKAIKQELTDDQLGMSVAIDIESGAYVVSNELWVAVRELKERDSAGEIFVIEHGRTIGNWGYHILDDDIFSLVSMNPQNTLHWSRRPRYPAHLRGKLNIEFEILEKDDRPSTS